MPLVLLVLALLLPATLPAQEPGPLTLEAGRQHLRAGTRPEWSETAAAPHTREMRVGFTAPRGNEGEWTLSVRQEGVRRGWRVWMNGVEVGRLHEDENPMTVAFAIPPGAVSAGDNVLHIEPLDTLPDDVVVGPVILAPVPRREHLAAATLVVAVREEDGGQLPARITIVDEHGALRETGAKSGGLLAVREGVVYSGDGRAVIPLPAGRYTVHATRGFEYSVDSAAVDVRPGQRVEQSFTLRREVPTAGWISADTHVHTLTHSGHGDASIEERVITVAGEGLELPVLTDHNVHADLEPAARALGMRRWFTPIRGNELTTPVGHFNLFPVAPGAAVPPAQLDDWDAVARAIGGVEGVRTVVLNHARDVHAGFRPLDAAGRLPGDRSGDAAWRLPAIAMEVVNSGAQLSDPLTLARDWMGLLRRGYRLTPVGASDSHDVSRYVVGQGRTYIRAEDADPGAIDVGAVVERFNAGAVTVSFGLLAEIVVGDGYGPGETLPAGGADEEIEVAVRVLGPAWTRATAVTLYLDGEPLRTAEIADPGTPGVKWSGSWRVTRPPEGGFLVAIAEGSDPERLFWPIAKPYQATSPDVEARVFGVTGAVWLAPR